MRSSTVAAAAVGLFAGSSIAANLQPIVIKGSKFFYANGTQFFIKGVAYQQDYTGGAGTGSGSTNSGQTYQDSLANPSNCKRDIPYLQQLETNVVRVYAVNPDQNHDECMSMLADAGIYVFADLSAPVSGESINQDDPQWNNALYARYTSVIHALAGYTNVIGFFAGNEVSNQPNNTNAMPFVKAAVRDSKAYIKKAASRPIYVGYAADDDATIRVPVSEFMVCDNQDDAVDFWGYNIYEWCGADSTFQSSGYQARTQEFSSYAKPAFFAEYGCITPPPRTFEDTPVILGPQMDKVWSGGIAYQYFQTTNDYGLVNIDSSNNVQTLAGFNSLSQEIRKASPTGTSMNDYTPTNTPWPCPNEGSNWEAAATPLPPPPNNDACNCLYNSLGCVVRQGVNPQEYGKQFGYVCGLKGGRYCNGIVSNGTTGQYGAWSMCDAEQQLSYVYDQYFQDNGQNPSACGFSNTAQTQSPQRLSGTCAALVAQAGTAGTGTIAAPTGTAIQSVSGAPSSSSKGAANVYAPRAQSGLLPAAILMSLAVISGAGIILL